VTSKDVLLTGKWAYTFFERRGSDHATTTLKIKGHDPITQTYRSNSIWGNIGNVRRSSNGHIKADLYENRRKIATMKLHKSIDIFGDYGNRLDGRLRLDLRSEKLTLWDSDIASSHWITKITYVNLV
jgi:hypothetical protein